MVIARTNRLHLSAGQCQLSRTSRCTRRKYARKFFPRLTPGVSSTGSYGLRSTFLPFSLGAGVIVSALTSKSSRLNARSCKIFYNLRRRLTSRSTRTQPALPTSMSHGSDFSAPSTAQPPVGPG